MRERERNEKFLFDINFVGSSSFVQKEGFLYVQLYKRHVMLENDNKVKTFLEKLRILIYQRVHP